MSHIDVKAAEAFLTRHPVDTVDLLIPDLNGVLRGKRIHRDALTKVYQEGICLPGSVFAASITGDTVEATGLGFDEGDADRCCWPIPGTLKPVPWEDNRRGQVFMAMYELDGTPFFADPRQVLRRVTGRFEELGLTPVVALELEFYLIRRERAANGAPQPPLSPVTGEPERSTQVYGMTELDDYREFLDSLTRTASAQELPTDAAISEYAPGQYEINLKHEPDAESACDHALQLKRLIKAVAREHGMEATFMAKPYPGLTGNGMHLHVSLVNDSGENVFASEEPLANPLLGHAAAGLAATMAQWMALFAPNVNAFRRFQPDSYVPLAPTYGYNNRTLALRVPSGHAPARRIEHRVAGADANPFLLMAAVLAGMHHGLTRQLPAPEPVTGNAYATVAPGLPLNWLDALRLFEHSSLAREYFGERFCAAYLANKDQERRTFEEQVTALEYAWYLRTV